MEWSSRWEEVKESDYMGLDFSEEIVNGSVYKDLYLKKLFREIVIGRTKRSFQKCMHNLILISVQSCRNTRASSSVIFFSTTNLLLFENHKSLFPIRITLSIQETHQEMR